MSVILPPPRLTALAWAIALSFNATAATTDYSNQTIDHGIVVTDAGNNITANNLVIEGTSFVESANNYNEGIFIGGGSSGTFGGDRLEVRFDKDDTTHSFAGIHLGGKTTGNATAVFDSAETIIDVSGSVAGKWGYGLLVNGTGNNTAKFTGGDVGIKTTTEA